MDYSQPIEKLIQMFRQLPGVGYKLAQRYAYSIIESDKHEVDKLIEAIEEVKEKIKFCDECGTYTDRDVCEICKNRSHKTICVVKEPKDILAMEKIKSYEGTYHVLFGCINPLEGKGPNDIRIKELLARINKYDTNEVIMATNPDVEGDATAMYIAKILKPLGVKVSRLAQGIAMGSDLEYADEVTLARALEARQTIN